MPSGPPSVPSGPPRGSPTAPLPQLPPLPQSDSSSLNSWYAPPLPSPVPPPSGPPVALPPPPTDPYATRIDGPYPTRQGGMGPVPPVGDPTQMLGDLRPVAPSADWPPPGWLPPGGPRRSRRALIPAIVVAALVAAVAGVLVFRGHPAQNTAGGAPTPAATTPSAASKGSQKQAAGRLSSLLAQSVTDRGAVINAVVDVRACGSSLRQDARIFSAAASSRERLLARLRNLPGRSVLSAVMLRDLTGAWQASAQADTDLAQWANTKVASGCHAKGADDSLQASYAPDGRATADKKAFAGRWDPVANRYGLTAYRWDQL